MTLSKDITSDLEEALMFNNAVTSLVIELPFPQYADAAIRENGPLDRAFKFNTRIVELSVIGATLPPKWQAICRRNTCLTISAPQSDSLRDLRQTDDCIDLTGVPWASPAGPQLDLPTHSINGDITVNGVRVSARGVPHSHDEEYMSMFQSTRMAEIAAHQILGDHPNVAKLHHVLFSENAFPAWICTERAACSLFDRIYNGQTQLQDDLLGIFAGLEYIHGHGIVHSNLTPHNVVVRYDDVVKITEAGGAVPRFDYSSGHTALPFRVNVPPEVRSVGK